jgi:penicillin-binding protein 2
MKPLGFGQFTGIDLQGEVRGVLPSQAWKRGYFKQPEQKKWFAGETISLGIGQGYNTFTMLQLAQATATLVNGGVRHTPHLVTATQDAVTHASQAIARPEPVDLGFRPEHLAVVRKAMVGVTQGGTSARVFAGAGYLSGGKTGTAQAVGVGQKQKYNAAKMEEFQRDHALYIAFAPADNPRVVVAAIVENAGFGAASAAPITRRVFDYLLMNQYPSEEDMAAMRRGAAAAPIGKPRDASEVAWPPGGVPLAGSSPGDGSITVPLAAAPAASGARLPSQAVAVSQGAAPPVPAAAAPAAAPQGILRTSIR